jgi:hypothetical protein
VPVPRFDIDARNVGDALALLREVPTEFTKLVFWDPQFQQLLDKQHYGNEGLNRRKRRKQLPAMSADFIASCDAEIGRITLPSGYCCRWVDEFQLLNGLFKIAGLEHVGVIHWNNGRPGMGKRVRPSGGSMVIMQGASDRRSSEELGGQVENAADAMRRPLRKNTLSKERSPASKTHRVDC